MCLRLPSRHTIPINCMSRRWLPDPSQSPSGKPGAVQTWSTSSAGSASSSPTGNSTPVSPPPHEDSGSGYTSPISQRNASSAFSTRGPASGSGRLIMITGIRSSRAETSFG